MDQLQSCGQFSPRQYIVLPGADRYPVRQVKGNQVFARIAGKLNRLRTMAPLVTIIVCAVVGFLVHGIIGLLAGLVAGYVLGLAVGTLATAWSGGLLPRKVRKQSAILFYMNHQPAIDSCMQDMSDRQKLRLIESLLERVFRRAAVAAPLLSKSMGMSAMEVEEAIRQEAAEEKDPKIRGLILLLTDHILTAMY